MADESVVVRISLHDAISAGLVKVEAQAKSTKHALKSMDDGSLGKNAKKTAQDVNILQSSLSRLRKQSGDVGFALKAIKLPLLAAAAPLAVSGINALAGGVTSLLGPIGRLGGLLGAIPAGISLLGSTLATVKLGLKDVGKALKVLNNPAATVDQVNKALKGLSPSAVALVKALHRLQPEMKKLRESAASNLLPGLTTALQYLMPVLPVLNSMLSGMGGALGKVASNLAKLVGSKGFATDLNIIFMRQIGLVASIGEVLTHLISIFRHVAVAAGPMVAEMGKMLAHGAAWLNWQAASGRNSGKLEAYFNRSLEQFKLFGRILRDLGMGLFNIIKLGLGLGDSMYVGLAKAMAAFRAWTTSAKGQQRITKWFDDSRLVLAELGKILWVVVGMWGKLNDKGMKKGGLVDTLALLRTQLLPVIEVLVLGVGNGLGPAMVKLATAFAKLLNFTSFQPLVTAILVVADLFDKIMTLADSSPILHTIATDILVLGLAFKTAGLVSKYTGVGKAAKAATPHLLGFTRGMMGSEKAGIGVAAKLGAKVAAAFTTTAGPALAAGVEGPVAASTGALSFLIGPIGLIIAAVAALGIGLFVLYKKWQPFHDLVDRTWQALQRFWDGVLGGVEVLWQFAQSVWDVFLRFSPFGILLNHVDTILGALWGSMKFVWEILSAWIPVLGTIFMKFTFLGQLFTIIRDNWGTVLGAVKFAWDAVRDSVAGVIKRISDAIGKVKEFAMAVANSPLGKVIGFAIDTVKTGVKAGVNTFGNDIKAGAEVVKVVNAGAAQDVNSKLKGGDTLRPRARMGDIGNTLAAHSRISAATGGNQLITNVWKGGFGGSDHHAGKALDLVGSGLGGYRDQVKAEGGYAEFHGSGDERHLHAAYGDTARPRANMGVDAKTAAMGTQLTLNGPLVGTVIANTEVDVERAVKRGIRQWIREREERS